MILNSSINEQKKDNNYKNQYVHCLAQNLKFHNNATFEFWNPSVVIWSHLIFSFIIEQISIFGPMTCIFFHPLRHSCTLYHLDTDTWSSHRPPLPYRRHRHSLISALSTGPFAPLIWRWCSPSGLESFSSGTAAWTVPSVLCTPSARWSRWPGSGVWSRRRAGNATSRCRRPRWCSPRTGRPGWPSRWSPRQRGPRPRASAPLPCTAKPSPSDPSYRSQCTFLSDITIEMYL